MSNSSLVSYTKLSPNNSGKRTHSIDRITPHCVVGQLSVETLGSMFAKSSYEASCNYAIGSDGRVALIVDEGQRSWCSSSKSNDQRAVTIECASDKTSPYAFNDTVYAKLIELCVDICRRNGKTKLLWISNKDKALAYEPKSGEMLLTVHRWFANKACPGDWMMARMGDLASKVTAKLSGSTTSTPTTTATADVTPKYYRVRKTWADVDSQLGAYSILDNAIKCAEEAGYRYGVFDWTGKEVYRMAMNKTKVVKFFYPGYTKTNSGDYQSHGAGCVWHDQNGCCLVYDAYWKGSPACEKLIQYLVDNKLTYIDFAVLSHAHGDHGGGFFEILGDKRFKVGTFVCYDSDSLKLAGDGTENGKSAAGDKAYLNKLIALAKEKGAKVLFVKTGDKIDCGEISFEVCRNQPTAWSEYDTGEAWAYLNDGSINLYERACHVLLCGDGGGKKAAQYFNGDIAVCESEHHGNGDGKSKVEEVKSHGCKLAIECNNEKHGPGSCSWTRYGAGRFRDADIPVWMLNDDIKGVVNGGKMTVSQGNKKMTFDVPFGKIFYRVRKSWGDTSSQIGAFTVLAKAKECVDAHPGYKVYDENGKQVYPAITTTPAASAKPQTDQEKFIAKIGPMAKADMAKNGILACITIAQAILESGWGKSELAVNANNLFGMKKSLSGNTWRGSSWDGKSVYSKQTKEVYASGLATVQADFRAYKSWEMSVNDHSAYLLGAKNGSSLRYKGLQGCADYKKAAQIIKDGGYATATDYVSKLCKLIEQYDLTKFNTTYKPSAATSGTTAAAAGKPQESSKPKLDGLFRVRKSWSDASSQKGAFHVLENAKECAEKNPGFCVFDESGKCIYESKAADVPFLVRVDIDDLNIRTGPGTNYKRTRYIPKGTYTIVEVKDGKGSTAGWGRLKSGAGWISLDFAVKLK